MRAGALGPGRTPGIGIASGIDGTGWLWRLALVLLAGLALWLDLRTCMALALALLLLLVSPGRLPGQPVAATRWLAWLGQRS